MQRLFKSGLLIALAITAAQAHETIPNPGFDITSDFGPRILDNETRDFHRAIDYSRAEHLSIPLLEDGRITRLSYSTLSDPLDPQAGGILIVEISSAHKFRY